MRIIRVSAIPALLILFAGSPQVHAQKSGAEWKALQKEAQALYDAGKYDPALAAAKKALAIAEKKVGPHHPETATSLEIIGLILVEQAQYAQAEPLHNRALEIREKALGPNHADVASSLDNLANLYQKQGQYAKAEPLYQRSLAIRVKALGPDHPAVAVVLNDLGMLSANQAQDVKAESLYKRALAIWEKALGPDHLEVASTLNNLADLICSQGQYAHAETMCRRALAIREKALGPDHPSVAMSMASLAIVLEGQGKYAPAEALKRSALAIQEKALGPAHPDVARSLGSLAVALQVKGEYAGAEALLQRALAILEKTMGPDHLAVAEQLGYLAVVLDDQGLFARTEPLKLRALAIREKVQGPDHPQVAGELSNLAFLYEHLGRHVEAEELYKRALAIRGKSQGPDHPDLAEPLGGLAALYYNQGKYAQAEPLKRQALAITEKAYGLEHPNVALQLNNLALNYETQGDYAQAEPLYLRALSIVEKAFGKEHRDVGSVVNNLAFFYFRQAQYKKAEPLMRRALAIREKVLGPDHPDVAESLNYLGDLCRVEKRYSEAEPLLSRALAIMEKVYGPNHPDVAIYLNNLANLKRAEGQFAQGEPLYARSLAIRERNLGADHPFLGRSLVDFADFYQAQEQPEKALPLMRRASGIYHQRIVNGVTGDAPVQEAVRFRNGFFKLLSLLDRNPMKEARYGITDESFQVAQLAQATGVGAAVAKMAVRFARGDDPIAELVRRKQDALDQRAKVQARLVRASSLPPDHRKPEEEQKQRDEVFRLGRELDSADAELDARFPSYQMLTRPEPLRVSQVQALLRPNEAMIVFVVAKDQSWMWVVRASTAEFISLNTNEKTLAEDIKKLRKQMEMGAPGQLRPVDVATLHSLFQRVFAPAVPHLTGIKHVMVVPSGPLQSLPFAMLVASPSKGIRSNADYRKVDWLMKRYAFSVLPSVGSIQAFRQFTKLGKAQESFIGFGDPLLGEVAGAMPSERSKLRLAELFRKPASSPDNSLPFEVADVEIIRQQVRLPESGDEIKAMARIAKAGPDSIWLQEKATEKNVKTLDLSKYRMIAFATHGVMADEFGHGMEPGLLLTPPAHGTPEDDGYLAAGEIARLKLNADWVLLSACNTAAADGSPGAEGMSGLAKAFFYAGSRSLLVSHWPVASEATVALTTRMLREYEAKPGRGKAEAHRKAMLALMNTAKHPEYAHPLFWAPFVVVGEGGATRAKTGHP